MYNTAKSILEAILFERYDPKDPAKALSCLTDSRHLLQVKKGDTILNQGDPVKYLYFLLKGSGLIFNCAFWNQENLVDHVQALDILGLVEHLCHFPYYTAFVVAASDCTLYRINADDFTKIIKSDAALCYQALCALGSVTESSMNRAEAHSIFRSSDVLGHYLFLCSRKHLPYVCPITRKELADELHINLRTLYRNINYMRDQQYLSLQHGKIVITEEHFKRLNSRYEDIIL